MVHRIKSIFVPVVYVFAVLVLFQFFTVQIVLGFYTSPNPEVLVEASSNIQNAGTKVDTKAGTGIPVRIKIPSIRVNALVRSVGLTPTGAMGIPKLPRDTAWYMYGPKPGEKGSAVISGHVNWLYGAIGVFARLNALKKGDVITVQDDRGLITSFVVRETRSIGKNQDATDVFRSYDGKAHLNLVTCSGIWDKTTKMYTKRLVVFADKVVQ